MAPILPVIQITFDAIYSEFFANSNSKLFCSLFFFKKKAYKKGERSSLLTKYRLAFLTQAHVLWFVYMEFVYFFLSFFLFAYFHSVSSTFCWLFFYVFSSCSSFHESVRFSSIEFSCRLKSARRMRLHWVKIFAVVASCCFFLFLWNFTVVAIAIAVSVVAFAEFCVVPS